MRRAFSFAGVGLALALALSSQATAQTPVYAPLAPPGNGVPGGGSLYRVSPGAQGRHLSRQTGAEGRRVGRQMGAVGRNVGRPISNAAIPSVGQPIRNAFPQLDFPLLPHAAPAQEPRLRSRDFRRPWALRDADYWNYVRPDYQLDQQAPFFQQQQQGEPE